ncbi:hypothetical protein [Bacillus sp. UMB0893]|uniref:hypothetical protein n=1 Tax=Bacillus sp. UMB0893 TaxID=2066053 RepID=UPI0015DF76B5|nr:hypothetical protein [Bacillus sp. UMB0893]
MKWLEMLGIASFQIKMWQYYLIVFGISFIIYGYQKWQEGIFKDVTIPEKDF